MFTVIIVVGKCWYWDAGRTYARGLVSELRAVSVAMAKGAAIAAPGPKALACVALLLNCLRKYKEI